MNKQLYAARQANLQAGFRMIENPFVGGSIPPQATTSFLSRSQVSSWVL
jgi:hypothetical protein